MPNPDLDRIFLDNPSLDRDIFEQNQKKIDETRHIPKPSRKGGRLIAPYGGRRLVTDDKPGPRNHSGRKGYQTG
jgi:hypothetical protein